MTTHVPKSRLYGLSLNAFSPCTIETMPCISRTIHGIKHLLYQFLPQVLTYAKQIYLVYTQNVCFPNGYAWLALAREHLFILLMIKIMKICLSWKRLPTNEKTRYKSAKLALFSVKISILFSILGHILWSQKSVHILGSIFFSIFLYYKKTQQKYKLYYNNGKINRSRTSSHTKLNAWCWDEHACTSRSSRCDTIKCNNSHFRYGFQPKLVLTLSHVHLRIPCCTKLFQ